MVARKTVYCEYEFWKKFSEYFPKVIAPDESLIKKMQCWINTYDFICKSDLHFDISFLQLKDNMAEDDSLRILWKKHAGGYCKLSCDSDDFPELNKLSKESISDSCLKSVYLTCLDSIDCKNIAEKFGIIAFNTDSTMNADFLFKDNGVAIKKKNIAKKYSWRDLENVIEHPCNSLIIVDNYILAYTEKINENLMCILDILIPKKKMEIPFHLSIFTYDMKYQAQNRFDDLKKRILIKRNGWTEHDLKITIYKCERNAFHDRAIITNNMWIGCGGGFDLFSGNKSCKTTTISICYPFLQNTLNWLDEAYTNLLKEAERFANKNDLKSIDEKGEVFHEFYIGDGVNRLIG